MTTAMRAEIDEIPGVVERALAEGDPDVERIAAAIRAFRPGWVSFAGRGTSDCVCTYGRYLVEVATGLPVVPAAASATTLYRAAHRWEHGLLVSVSQSGRSADIVAVSEAARRGGALTVAITNDPASPLAAAAEHVLPARAGEELAVAATKTYVACLVALAALVARWIGTRRLADGLERLPAVLRGTLHEAAPWIEASGIVPAFAGAQQALIVSRGYDLATALEIALKLQETAGLFAIGYSTADLEHGPVALARADVPVLAIRPDGDAGRRIDGALERVRAIGARPWIVGGQETPSDLGAPRSDGHSLRLPLTLPIELQAACLILPGQLLAEAVSRARGRDPDRPAGLTKVTTTL